MTRIQDDWNTLNEKECEIVRYYTIIGMRYTIIFFGKVLEIVIFILNYENERKLK